MLYLAHSTRIDASRQVALAQTRFYLASVAASQSWRTVEMAGLAFMRPTQSLSTGKPS